MVAINFFMTNLILAKLVLLIHIFLNTGLFKMEVFLTKVNNLKLLMVVTEASIFNVRYLIYIYIYYICIYVYKYTFIYSNKCEKQMTKRTVFKHDQKHQMPVLFEYRVLFVIYFFQFFPHLFLYIRFSWRVFNNLLLYTYIL